MIKADEYETEHGDARFWYGLYLFISAIGIACVVTGFVFLFRQYTGCDLGEFVV
jgi:hypothetical protein